MAKKKSVKKPANKKAQNVCPSPEGCSCGCNLMCGIIVLLIALLFLATDLGWITWWKLSWWTVAFIMIALHKLFSK